MSDDYEYDPEYQAAYQQTLAYQQERYGYALADVGNDIAKALLPHLITTSSLIRAFYAELHADEVERMGWMRRFWHLLTGHRR